MFNKIIHKFPIAYK